MKTSILILTHNHQRWLSCAIDSALKQVTDFDFEIVIGVDKSDDRTLDIATQYANHHENIRMIQSQKNIGGRRNFINTLDACTGEFIAYLDGDDYWSDAYKLADQVSFLEANQDHSASVTQARIRFCGRIDNRLPNHYSLSKESYDSDDVIANDSFGATSSLVFRKKCLVPIPHWFEDIAWGDRAIKGMLAAHGKFHNLRRKTMTYRCNNWGAWNNLLDMGNDYILESKKLIDEYVQDYHQQLSTT